ncbi:MAG: gamma-glutamyl-gamma-aminobutyrate hydrolase family protein [Bacteroidetes bacterium]|nr:gamma-glutamyl-gamma-aminobutyrate hydrolase family protein [Bacteroidota bacterium]
MCKIAISNSYQSDEKFQNYKDWLHLVDQKLELEKISFDDKNLDLEKYNGFVLTGGSDVDPNLYKSENHFKIYGINKKRDEFELKIIETAFKNKIPLIGICRGLQVANVYFKGTLWEDLEIIGNKNNHKSINDIQDRSHEINISENTLLHQIVKNKKVNVNSSHHQGARIIGDELIESAISDDGVIEALELKDKTKNPFMLFVQWHPEREINKEISSIPIAKAFIIKAKENCINI